MRLAVNLGYFGGGSGTGGGDRSSLELAVEADRLGYAACWVAEAYGSDAPTVLAWVAARTERIDIGSAVMQIPARSAAMTAMTAATLDALSGGRFRLGLGVSGPQVSEGWHGVRFDEPLARTREYVDVVRLALARCRVEYAGRHLVLPLPDGPGKALRLTVHPVREHVPLYLAAVGPRSLELTGEIADGWLGVFFAPEHAAASLDHLRAGRLRAAPDPAAPAAAAGSAHPAGPAGPPNRADPADPADADPLAGFDVCPSVPVAVDDDVEAAADLLRGYYALYVGGMGSREQNFYHRLAVRMGFGDAAETVQDLYLAGRHREAAAAVPTELVDATALIGPPERVTGRIGAFEEAGVTTLTVVPFAADSAGLAGRLRTLHVADEAARAAGVLR